MRGDGQWIASAAEVLYDGHESELCQAVSDLLGKYGTKAVLEVIEGACDAAYDHLADNDAPILGINQDEARQNISTVRTCLRTAGEVL